MNREEIADKFKKLVIDDMENYYQDLLNKKNEPITYDAFIKIPELYKKLNPEDQEVFMKVIKFVSFNTLSLILNEFSNQSILGPDMDFKLSVIELETNHEVLNLSQDNEESLCELMLTKYQDDFF